LTERSGEEKETNVNIEKVVKRVRGVVTVKMQSATGAIMEQNLTARLTPENVCLVDERCSIARDRM